MDVRLPREQSLSDPVSRCDHQNQQKETNLEVLGKSRGCQTGRAVRPCYPGFRVDGAVVGFDRDMKTGCWSLGVPHSIFRHSQLAPDTHPLTPRPSLRPGAKREITSLKTSGHAQQQWCSSSLAANLPASRAPRWNNGASVGPLAERIESARAWSY